MILSSLCKSTPVLLAILVTAVAAAVVHLPVTRWTSAFVANSILCGLYLARRGSLPASIAAHAGMNASVWFPNLMVATYFLR